MSDSLSEIDALLGKKLWHVERRKLRQILLACGLDEQVKWGKLCYAYQDGNVAIIFGLKTYCAVGFFKGSLLADEKNLLLAPGRHSQAMRQMRFTHLDEITAAEADLRACVKAAKQIEKDGLKVDFSEKDDLAYPAELQAAIKDDPAFAKAFATLTPGRQRGYVIHFSAAKQSETRHGRIRKCRSAIIEGKGLHDR